MKWTYPILVGIALLVIGAAVATPAAGQSYYNNSTGIVSSDSPRNATLSNIVDVAVSVSPTLIGTGEQDPSGTGFEGVLLTGIVFAGSALAAMARTRVGPVGGAILGAVVSYGLVDLGYAPAWVKPLLLFGIGAIVFVSFRRVLR